MDDENGTNNNNAFPNVTRNGKWVILQFGVRGCHFDLREREEDVLPCLAPLTHCT